MDDEIKNGTELNVLSLEDSVKDFEILREQLIDAGYKLIISRVEKERDFAASLRGEKKEIILADFKVPGFDAFGALRLRDELCPEVPLICVSGSIGEETAIELIKQGAADYVLKDRLERLPFAVKRALDTAKEKETRRLAEEALHESERNYETLADSGQALIWSAGTDKLCNYFNRVWLDFTGRTLEQEKGNGWVEGVHPEDSQVCLDLYTGSFDRREKFSMEYRLKRFDGEYRWILDEGCPRYDSKGEFIGYLGHCLDITERKRTVEALTASETRYRRLFESAKDGILLLHAETGRIMDVNPYLMNLLGFSKERFLERAIWEIGFFKDLVANQDKFMELQREEYVRYEDLPLETSDGRKIDVEFVSNVYWVDHKKVIQCNIRDITERKLAKKKLQQSEMQYRSLTENSPDLIARFDRRYRHLYVNSAAAGAGRCTPEEYFGKSMVEVGVSERDAEKWEKRIEAVFETGRILDVEDSFETSAGLKYFNTKVVPEVAPDGSIRSVQSIARDITERKQAEEEIRKLNETLEQRVEERTAQLRAANDELKAFTYSVSHDLRAPLRSIHGFTQILTEEYAEKLDEEGRRICSVIRFNTLRMGKLIEDLLAFSRLGRTEMQESYINMKALVDSVFLELTDAESRERMDLEVGDLCDVHGDPSMVRQVWTNLLSNAIKYSSKRERAAISVTCKKETARCVYRVKDNGAGFDMNYVNKLFVVFQRLHAIKDFEGTGVGLAIVQRIVQRHGGEVWAEGEVDRGAAFYFSLPVG